MAYCVGSNTARKKAATFISREKFSWLFCLTFPFLFHCLCSLHRSLDSFTVRLPFLIKFSLSMHWIVKLAYLARIYSVFFKSESIISFHPSLNPID